METKIEQHRRRYWWWTWRVMALCLALLLMLVGATVLTAAAGHSSLVGQHPIPGKSVEIGGYQLRIHCKGQGNPTVVLDAGQHDFSVFWALVQEDKTDFSRFCAGDRVGFDSSDQNTNLHTVETKAAELHTLLVNPDEGSRSILIGHPIGGALVRLHPTISQTKWQVWSWLTLPKLSYLFEYSAGAW